MSGDNKSDLKGEMMAFPALEGSSNTLPSLGLFARVAFLFFLLTISWIFSYGHTTERKIWPSDSTVIIEPNFQSINFNEQGVASVDISPNGRNLVAGGHDFTLRLWDIKTCELQKTIQFLNNEIFTNVMTVNFSPDGKWLVSGNKDWAIRLWKMNGILKTRESIKLIGHEGTIRSTIFNSTGQILFSSSTDGTIKFWKPFETTEAFVTIKAHQGTIYSLSLSPNEKFLISGGENNTVKLWDLGSLKLIRELTAPGTVRSAIFSPDGSVIAGAITHLPNSLESYVIIWETTSGNVIQKITEYSPEVVAVAIHPNGRKISAGNWNGTIKTWDISQGTLLQTLTPDDLGNLESAPSIQSLKYTGDGKFLITGSYYSTPWLWSFKTGKIEKVFRLQGCTP